MFLIRGAEIMNLSSRRFLITQDGVLHRLADATFIRMPRNPGSHAVPVLAGQRVRMASLIVELVGGAPVRVVRSTFATLSFDEDGHMDSGMFTRQQCSCRIDTRSRACQYKARGKGSRRRHSVRCARRKMAPLGLIGAHHQRGRAGASRSSSAVA